MANVVDLKDIRANHHGIRADVAQLMIGPPPDVQEHLRQDIQARNTEIRAELARVTARVESAGARRDALREFTAAQAQSSELRTTQILPLLARGRADEAKNLFTGVQLERERRMAILADELVDSSTHAAEASVAASDQAASNALTLLAVAGALMLAAGVALALLFERLIAGPLRAVSAAVETIAGGDLTVELADDRRLDEVGVLSRSFRTMVVRLREMMRDIGEGVGVLATSASEITASTTQVAASSAQTASAVAETSATAEEVKQTARVASDKAAQVQASAQKSVDASQAGLRAMDDSIVAMREIRQQMDSLAQSVLRLADQGMAIGEIISTVNDLADQSNLLSVNAAIEAARAGEEGAGFRIVAQEIRSLAEQSKQATVQVRALLGDIQKATSSAVLSTEQAGKAVKSGADLSESAMQSIRAMATTISESAQAAAQIAASAQQQAVGMDQVAFAMQNINEASAQNVAASRQTETAAHGLQELGLRLKGVVAQFHH
jgi:methyl-accepting chemotaxis protein